MRSTFKVSNPSQYVDLVSTKEFVELPRPYLWKSVQAKVLSYQVRLYYEWLYCTSRGGSVYYYTLTYNDKSIPRYNGFPCFRYDDIRQFVNGAFVKALTRKFNCSFKYFISCESGEGKGKRGYMNNPHYHCLFFIYPEKDFIRFSPEDFRSLVRFYWQGYDVGDDSVNPSPRDFTYGIAKEGSRRGCNDCGLVSDFHALTYVTKYVVKDVDYYNEHSDDDDENEVNRKRSFSSQRFHAIKSAIYSEARRFVYDDPETRYLFAWQFRSDADLVSYSFRNFKEGSPEWDDLTFVDWFVSENLLAFERFIAPRVFERYKFLLNRFWNSYGPKVRISNGVGLSALDCVTDESSPMVPLPSSKGMKNVPVGNFLYRKLFYDVKRDELTGNVYYQLNQKGIDVRINNLQHKLDKRIELAKMRLSCVKPLPGSDGSSENLYNQIRHYVNNSKRQYYSFTESLPSYDDFRFLLRRSLVYGFHEEDLLRRYAEYKEVYEGRYLTISYRDGSACFPQLDINEDYSSFLAGRRSPEYFRPEGFSICLAVCGSTHVPYSVHPYFYPYIRLFSILDILCDYFDFADSEQKRKTFLNKQELLNFHNSH